MCGGHSFPAVSYGWNWRQINPPMLCPWPGPGVGFGMPWEGGPGCPGLCPSPPGASKRADSRLLQLSMGETRAGVTAPISEMIDVLFASKRRSHRRGTLGRDSAGAICWEGKLVPRCLFPRVADRWRAEEGRPAAARWAGRAGTPRLTEESGCCPQNCWSERRGTASTHKGTPG